MNLSYVNMWNGLYTYSKTIQDQKTNSIKNLVRIQLDDSGSGKLYIPDLTVKSKTYNNVEFNINLKDNKYIYGDNTNTGSIKIEIGGILLYTGDTNRIGITLAVTINNKNYTISGNPRGNKLLNNLSIKLSGVTQGLYPDITPWIDDSGSGGGGRHPGDDSGSGGGGRHPGDDSGSGGGGRHPGDDSGSGGGGRHPGDDSGSGGGGRHPGDDSGSGGGGRHPGDDSGGGDIIPPVPIPGILPPSPPSPPQPQPLPSRIPFNPFPHGKKNPTAKEIMNLVKKNHIPGQKSNPNYCPPLFPYAFGDKQYGQGDRCCIGKPYKNESSGIYECDSEGSCYGENCGNNSKQCNEPPCHNNPNVIYGTECPMKYPYPYNGSHGQMGSGIWGGDGFFCCSTDPGPNNICPLGDRAACPQPQCRKNTSSVRLLKNEESIISSQKINNNMQIDQTVITMFNNHGIPINTKLKSVYNSPAVQYITFSTKPISAKYSTKYLITKMNINSASNNFVQLTTSKKNIIQISNKYKNYIGKIVGKPLYMTPTIDDMTTCKSNNTPLYPIGDSLGRDFPSEWQQMGEQKIDDSFIAQNVNSSDLTDDVLNKRFPYIIYKNPETNKLYYYDKSREPIKFSTISEAKTSCSGFMDPTTPYFSTMW